MYSQAEGKKHNNAVINKNSFPKANHIYVLVEPNSKDINNRKYPQLFKKYGHYIEPSFYSKIEPGYNKDVFNKILSLPLSDIKSELENLFFKGAFDGDIFKRDLFFGVDPEEYPIIYYVILLLTISLDEFKYPQLKIDDDAFCAILDIFSTLKLSLFRLTQPLFMTAVDIKNLEPKDAFFKILEHVDSPLSHVYKSVDYQWRVSYINLLKEAVRKFLHKDLNVEFSPVEINIIGNTFTV